MEEKRDIYKEFLEYCRENNIYNADDMGHMYHGWKAMYEKMTKENKDKLAEKEAQ